MKFSSLPLGILGFGLAFAPFFGCESERRPSIVCEDDEEFVNGQCLREYTVRLNSVGFLPERVKRASFAGKKADFSVVRVSDDKEVFQGKAEGPVESDTKEKLYIADFTQLEEEGEFYVKVGEGRSAPFRIASDALEGALDLSMLGLYGQRCGVAVELEHEEHSFSHEACHLEEASLSRLELDEKRDDTGGWHDAGDYGKYVVNGAFAVSFLLAAYEHFPKYLEKREFEIPERGGKTPDILDEARVELEWILKVQLDDGSFTHKVTALSFEGNIMPEDDKQARYFTSASSTATAGAVAVLAWAGRLYEEFDAKFAEKCLEAAQRGQVWLSENSEEVRADLTGVSTGDYVGGKDTDERAWALAELWETTGEAEYLAAFEELGPELEVRGNFDWTDTTNLALATYIRSAKEGRSPALLARVSQDFLKRADDHVSSANTHAYGRGFGGYYWGSNGVVARLSFNLIVANFIQPKAEYLDAIQLQLDHLLGRNVYGRSFVTGLGANPAYQPHHRPSVADTVRPPWPGLLIGGPHTSRFNEEPDENVPPALTWTDVPENYLHNEVAINWNTALVYALAALHGASDEGAGCASCLQGAPEPEEEETPEVPEEEE